MQVKTPPFRAREWLRVALGMGSAVRGEPGRLRLPGSPPDDHRGLQVIRRQEMSIPHLWRRALLLPFILLARGAVAQTPLDPLSLTKYIDPLPIPGVAPMAGPNYYEIGAYQIEQQLHGQLPPTTVYG